MDLSYPEIGATRGPLPRGYHHIDRRVPIGHGRAAFEAAVTALLGWEMHRRSGLGVKADTATAATGSTVVLTLGPVRIPCRVVYVVDEGSRAGFAYGTLDGHPEQGEERFVIEYDESDATVFAHITAFSRPGRWFTKLGGPAGRVVQKLFTDRYFAALRAAVRT
ncbi:DUF1990 domain-containing protein [Rhodococcus sp. G-MC3]|uniref:DUF1990 family protein n=1 Tax=Rhodococcus sp. G-MC3 TaxID=3046209 RepID=UPI0024BA091A|nr:DUF1990 domain-containing protein [Rhodococcus sp. G-MC3]MDJ0391900.1 DUF1990 domain-containing protein [Rhodococcus sp. G-MC3]